MMSEAQGGMAPQRLTVSQVRVAASCPRIAYFDAEESRRRNLRQPHVTRIWKTAEASTTSALGGLFHDTIERFNASTRHDPTLWGLLASCDDSHTLAQKLLLHIYCAYLKRPRLYAATANQQRAFMQALLRYVGELAEIMLYGRSAGIADDEMRAQLFGDQRRQVDVTFAVGPNDEAINIYGRLDYVFYDWRTTRRRIIDYKLTPAHQPTNDLFQVSLYALMHHVQHGTEPDAAVLYLYPQRIMEERTWSEIHAQRQQIYDFLASLHNWLRYDETTGVGLKPPGEPLYCGTCPWQHECIARLGPKSEGTWLTTWRDAAQRCAAHPGTAPPPEPRTTAQRPARRSDRNVVPEAPISDCATAHPVPSRAPAHGTGTEAEPLWIGTWEADKTAVHIPPTVLATHALVAGAAGSGKTWLAKVILEEAVRNGAAVIAIDPQGDLVQMLLHQEVEARPSLEAEAMRDYAARVDVRIWTPGSSIASRLSFDPLRLPADEDLSGFAEPQRRQEELEQLLQTSAASLVDLARAGGEPDSQQTLLLEILRRLSRRDCGRVSLQRLADAVHEPEIVALENPDRLLRKTERERLARKLGNFLRGPSAALFTEGTPLDVEQLVQPSPLGRTPLNVIYLNHLVDEDQKQFVVSVLATEVYRWMITRAPEQGPFLVFYLDEARDFLPAGNRQTPAKQPLRRLFSQGRKYGVGCVVAAQSPRSVEYEALSNCSTKLIGRLESQQDVERVREWFSREGRAPEWLAHRKGAEAGSFLGRWPEMDPAREGQSFRSRSLFSQHSGAWPPDRVEAEWRQYLATYEGGDAA